MSFFKHVKLHEYDISDLGIRQACYDELVADGNNSDEKQLRILAVAMCEEFKDYMRPLFAQLDQFTKWHTKTPLGFFYWYY